MTLTVKFTDNSKVDFILLILRDIDHLHKFTVLVFLIIQDLNDWSSDPDSAYIAIAHDNFKVDTLERLIVNYIYFDFQML